MIKHCVFILSLIAISPAIAGQPLPVTVMTYNIRYANPNDGVNYWDNRKDKVINLIESHDPDLIGFQEALKQQVDDLNNGLEGYSWFGVGRDDGSQKGEFSPVFFKKERFEIVSTNTFWLSETPDRPSKGWDASLPRIATQVILRDKDSGEQLVFINTHFDHIGKEARTNSARLLVKIAQDKSSELPVIISGDLNFEPSAAGYEYLSKTLKDTYTLIRHQDQKTGTYHGFEVTNDPGRRIDYIFISDDIEVIDFNIDTSNNGRYYPSDHLPVITKIKPGAK